MAASNFFEDINEYKTDIGLTKGKNLCEKGSKVKGWFIVITHIIKSLLRKILIKK